MAPELTIQIFFRGCGGFALIASCFGSAFSFSARVAFILSFSVLLSGAGVLDFLSDGKGGVAAAIGVMIPELLLGALLALPICIGCLALNLFARWSAAFILPGPFRWGLSPDAARSEDRFRSLILALTVLGGLSFLPFLPDVFARFAESLFSLPSAASPDLRVALFSRKALAASGQLAFAAALGIALPLIAVSFAFDAAALLVARYLAPLRADPALWSLRVLVFGAALSASLYSMSELVASVSRENVAQKRMSAVFRDASPLPDTAGGAEASPTDAK